MKIKTYLLLIIIPLGYLNAQGWETPIIDGYGEVKYFEKAEIKPNSSVDYKLLFDIKNETEKSGINKGLWVIARTLNMLSLGKVPSRNIKIVASIHGDASFLTLNNEAYQKKGITLSVSLFPNTHFCTSLYFLLNKYPAIKRSKPEK